MNARDDDVREAIHEYERTHWGRRGRRELQNLLVADPRRPLTELGELVSVTYRTRKGRDRELTDYQHEFSAKGLPILAFERRTQLLVIAGGIYRVNERGILD
jgi:hypothetical protein